MKKFVAVAGNIGVGKSTLVEMLCVRMGWEPFYEPVTENPYLADFYTVSILHVHWHVYLRVYLPAHKQYVLHSLNRLLVVSYE